MKQYCIIYKIAQRYEYFLEYPNPLCESVENNTLFSVFLYAIQLRMLF